MGIVVGTGIALLGIGWAVISQTRQTEESVHRLERERKAQLIIRRMQHKINELSVEINELEDDAAQANANRESIGKLNERLAKLQRAVASRKE